LRSSRKSKSHLFRRPRYKNSTRTSGGQTKQDGRRHHLCTHRALSSSRYRTGRCRRLRNLRSPWRRAPRKAEVPVRRIFGWVSGGRRIANSDRERHALAALQFYGGDDFGQQTGVCDASAVLCPEQVRSPFCTPAFLFVRPMNLASCAGRLMSATLSPGMLFGARTTGPLLWLDLAEGRLCLDGLAATAAVRLSSPGLATPRDKSCGDPDSPIPREPRKSHRRRPPLRFGPRAGASSIASGL